MTTTRMRLDKWLWATRLFKTRALAAEQIDAGRVTVNEQPAKPAREVRAGDVVALRDPAWPRTVVVLATSQRRGPAAEARLLYRETEASIAHRELLARQRRLAPEPAASLEQGRPTKRDRRRLAEWNRWSATADD